MPVTLTHAKAYPSPKEARGGLAYGHHAEAQQRQGDARIGFKFGKLESSTLDGATDLKPKRVPELIYTSDGKREAKNVNPEYILFLYNLALQLSYWRSRKTWPYDGNVGRTQLNTRSLVVHTKHLSCHH